MKSFLAIAALFAAVVMFGCGDCSTSPEPESSSSYVASDWSPVHYTYQELNFEIAPIKNSGMIGPIGPIQASDLNLPAGQELRAPIIEDEKPGYPAEQPEQDKAVQDPVVNDLVDELDKPAEEAKTAEVTQTVMQPVVQVYYETVCDGFGRCRQVRRTRTVMQPVLQSVVASGCPCGAGCQCGADCPCRAVSVTTEGTMPLSAGTLPLFTYSEPAASMQVIPRGYHAHRAFDGSIVVHHDSNSGVYGAHDGMSRWRIAEGGEPISTIRYSSGYGEYYTANAEPIVGSGRPLRQEVRNIGSRFRAWRQNVISRRAARLGL